MAILRSSTKIFGISLMYIKYVCSKLDSKYWLNNKSAICFTTIITHI